MMAGRSIQQDGTVRQLLALMPPLLFGLIVIFLVRRDQRKRAAERKDTPPTPPAH